MEREFVLPFEETRSIPLHACTYMNIQTHLPCLFLFAVAYAALQFMSHGEERGMMSLGAVSLIHPLNNLTLPPPTLPKKTQNTTRDYF